VIIKQFDLKKNIIREINFFLLYGKNIGLIEDTIKNSLKPILPKNIFNYEENDILKNIPSFRENLVNKSFFESE
jgi:DNA polymerase III delta subunit